MRSKFSMQRQNSVPSTLPNTQRRNLSASVHVQSGVNGIAAAPPVMNSKSSTQCGSIVSNKDLECQTTTTSIVAEQNQRSLPAFHPHHGNHACGRYHSFSIPSSNEQPPLKLLNGRRNPTSKLGWKRSSAASTCSKAAAICYGYASASYPFLSVREPDDDEDEDGSPPSVRHHCSIQTQQDEQSIEEGEQQVEETAHQQGKSLGQEEEDEQEEEAIFFTRLSDGRILPIYCSRPTGHQADQFIQSLSERQRDCLRRFMEGERPVEGEAYIWVREDATMKTTVLAIATLENHLKLVGGQHSQIRRVKWHHLSMDKASVYRYSIPQITTKFRLRVASFLSRNYRCCILCVWCLVIAMISVGIVLSVVFGSVPQGSGKTAAPLSPQQDRPKRNLVQF